MVKCYVVSVESMKVVTATSEAEAIEDAKQRFIEMLQKDEAELIVVEEFEND